MVLEKFSQLDDLIFSEGIEKKSLYPERKHATSFLELAESLSSHLKSQNRKVEDSELICLYNFFDKCIKSVIQNYPENIYWDFDFLFFHIYEKFFLYNEKNPEDEMNHILEKILKVMDTFGMQSNIRFRYIHDFLYGFDWCKWYRKQKSSGIEEELNPFGMEFLSYIENRGKEIQNLIREDDENYVKLDENTFRNPFLFSRDTEDEIKLLESLAMSGDIPIFSWRADAKFNAEKDYSLIRKERAVSLKILPNKMPGAHKAT